MKARRLAGDERGVALLAVLLVLLFLTILGLDFAFSVRMEAQAALNFKEEAQSYFLAMAGIQRAIGEIMGTWEVNYLDADGDMVFARRADFQGAPGTAPPATPKRKDLPLGTGSVSYSIDDEEAKLDVNRASREALVAILEAVGMGVGTSRDIVADSILDWIDNDILHRLNGAESDYYRALPRPYRAKNGPVEVMEEILLVRGVTPELFYGKESAGKGITAFLTATHAGRTNLNTASLPVLQAIFGANANYVLERRVSQPFLEDQMEGTVRSSTFTIRSAGRLTGSRVSRHIRAVARKEGVGAAARLVFLSWNDNAPARERRTAEGAKQ